MLDDISFENCGEGDVPAGSDQLSCDFEKDTCSWYHDYTASLLWKRSNGKFSDGPDRNGEYLTEVNTLLISKLKFIHNSFLFECTECMCSVQAENKN